MKKLVIHIILFILPLLLLLLIIPINKRLRYINLKDDCFNHGIWLHDRIFENPLPIDIAFLGSSHTINGVDDSKIETVLKEKQMHVANLGYCRLGRNLDYTILKELLQTKKTKILILEVLENENRYSHPIFPYVAAQSDVLLPVVFFNRDLIKDAFTALAFKTELLQEEVFSSHERPEIQLNPYGSEGHKDTAASDLLENFFMKRQQPAQPQNQVEHSFYAAYPKAYFEKIMNICRERNINICFLYLPSYGTALTVPSEIELYKKYGRVFLPPSRILRNRNNWFDENHLNKNGAAELSSWLGEQLKEMF